MKKMKRCAEGGEIEYEGTEEDAMATAKARIAQKDAEYAAKRAAEEAAAPAPVKRAAAKPAVSRAAKNVGAVPKPTSDVERLAERKPQQNKRGIYDGTAVSNAMSKAADWMRSKVSGGGSASKPNPSKQTSENFKPLKAEGTKTSFKKGGSVRGSGCAVKGVRKARMF